MIVVFFIYKGSMAKNIHTDKIRKESSRYEYALKVGVGDEVYEDPTGYDKIYHFKLNNFFRE